MKMNLLVKILGTFLLVEFVKAATNYCDPKLCTNPWGAVSPHIGCNNTGWNTVNCGATPLQVNMTTELKDAFLTYHNARRNSIASGNVTGFGPAVRMATVVWDDELAALAELNTKQCTMSHDKCHNTVSFKWSGQNLYRGGSKPNFANVLSQISGAMGAWYAEKSLITQVTLDKLVKNPAGHFTQMVTAHTTHIGCGIAQWTDSGLWKNIVIACNYAAINMLGSPIFVKGPAASNCTMKNPTYNSLCAVGEDINANIYDKALI